MKKLIAEIIFNTESILVSDSLLSTSFGALDRGNVTELAEYGIYANKGTLSFIDRNLSFKNLYEQYKGTTDVKVRFWIGYNDTCLATFDIENAKINDETNQVEIDLISHIMQWQNKKVHRSLFRQYNALFFSKSLLDLVEFAKEFWGIEVNIKTDRLARTIVNCPDIEDSPTVWDFMTEICQAGMCMIFDDEYGVPCICDTTPNNSNIIITPNKILGIGDDVESSIPNASITVVNRTKHKAALNDRYTKQIYLYDSNGDVVSYDQDLLTFEEYADVGEYHSAHVRYGVAFQNPTFSIDGIICRGDRGYKDLSSIDEDVVVKFRSLYLSLSLFSNHAIVELTISPSKYSPEAGFDPYMWFRNVRIYLKTTYYTDEDEEKSYTTSETKQPKLLTANKFIQTESTYAGKDLSTEILDTIKSRYANPIKCLEMECLLGEYKDNDGNVILAKGDLFKKYDTVIPYVIRNGKKEPYSIDDNGEPSSFEIVGVEYSYRGLFRQKLYLQENRVNIQQDFIKPDSLGYSTSSEKTIFVWSFSGLKPYTTYTISWSMKESILSDELEMYKDDSDNFCYFTFHNGTITINPISKDVHDLLNYTVDVESDKNGNIYIGSLFINYPMSSADYNVWAKFIEDNTNHILAFEKQS